MNWIWKTLILQYSVFFQFHPQFISENSDHDSGTLAKTVSLIFTTIQALIIASHKLLPFTSIAEETVKIVFITFTGIDFRYQWPLVATFNPCRDALEEYGIEGILTCLVDSLLIIFAKSPGTDGL